MAEMAGDDFDLAIADEGRPNFTGDDLVIADEGRLKLTPAFQRSCFTGSSQERTASRVQRVPPSSPRQDDHRDQVVGLEYVCKRLPALMSRKIGERVDFPGPVAIGGRHFSSALIERDFKSASGARLLRLLPHGVHFVIKLGDVRQEIAVMRALQCMNRRWLTRGVKVCNEIVEAVTYNIISLGTAEAGLIEAVPSSRTIRELGRDHATVERHQRVLLALNGDTARLNRLAATTVAYLTAAYALGLRDSHDDNIMLRDDGSVFRIDFGYIFGASPAVDAPPMAVSNDIVTALGEARWREVLEVCEQALVALSGDLGREPPAWACIRSVPEMAVVHNDALAYVRLLSLGAFRSELQHAHEWSLARATKNGIRDVVRYILQSEDDGHAAVKAHRRNSVPFSKAEAAKHNRLLSLSDLQLDSHGNWYVSL